LPINYSVILNQDEKLQLSSLIDENRGAGVAAVSRMIDRNLQEIFPEGTIVYADGSKHSIREYTNMLVSTTILDAERQATLEFIKSNPTDLVQVSIEGSAHEGCAIWEGEILSVSGSNPDYRGLDEALGGNGLFHPNCVHSIFPIYNDGFDSKESQRLDNMKTILGNQMRFSSNYDSLDAINKFLRDAERLLISRFSTSFSVERVGENKVLIGGEITLISTGELVKAKPVIIEFGLGDRELTEEEFTKFFVSPFGN